MRARLSSGWAAETEVSPARGLHVGTTKLINGLVDPLTENRLVGTIIRNSANRYGRFEAGELKHVGDSTGIERL